MGIEKYIPCWVACVEDPAPDDAQMIRASCRHGAFSVCNDRSSAIRLALDICRSCRFSEMYDDYEHGTRFNAAERKLLREHRLIP